MAPKRWQSLCVTRRAPVQTRYNVGKTYLLFQEFYGHAGVENRGRNFGPAPWLARALDVPPACPTRRPGTACLGTARLGTACHRPAPRTRLAAPRRAWPRPPWVWDAAHTQRQRAWRAQTPVVAYVHPDPSARTLTASPDSTVQVELRSEDHQRHHIRADVNFSKRFSLWDRLFCTWSAAERGGKQH